jgi:LacI family transcriptional regulator
MPVTMRDVAEKAGVSIKTVSRVINDQGEISEATRQRILQIIEELGYRPNRLAQGLLTGRTYTIGVIISDITDPFFPELILGAEQAARQRQYNVFLCNANREPDLETHYVNVLRDRRVDGLLLAGSRLQRDELKATIATSSAVILSPYAFPDATIFTLNDYAASKKVAEYLYSLGHRTVAFIDSGWSGSSERRREGFLSIFREHGLAPAGGTAFPSTVENGYQAALELFERRPDLSAIACYNDVLAIGALEAAHAVGRRVPDDLSVVGYDDIPEATRSRPPLTTIHYNRIQIGRDMMNRLLDLVQGKRDQHEHIFLEGDLLVRQSTSSARDS